MLRRHRDDQAHFVQKFLTQTRYDIRADVKREVKLLRSLLADDLSLLESRVINGFQSHQETETPSCKPAPGRAAHTLEQVAERAVRVAASGAVNNNLKAAAAASRTSPSPKKRAAATPAAEIEKEKQVAKTCAEQDVAAARSDKNECLSTLTNPEDSSQLLSALFDETLQLADSDPLLVETEDKSKTPKVSPLVSKGSLDSELASIALSIFKADKEEFDISKYTRAFFRRSIKLQGPLFVEFGLTAEAFDTQELSKKAKSFINKFSKKVVCTVTKRKEARESNTKGK